METEAGWRLPPPRDPEQFSVTRPVFSAPHKPSTPRAFSFFLKQAACYQHEPRQTSKQTKSSPLRHLEGQNPVFPWSEEGPGTNRELCFHSFQMEVTEKVPFLRTLCLVIVTHHLRTRDFQPFIASSFFSEH